MRRARFEIVATLGPASFGLAEELAGAGATALRLNASHLSPEDLGRRAREARSAAPDLPIVVDLQGAKMRVGDFAERPLAAGDTLRFALAPARANDVPLPHPEVFAAAEPDTLLGGDDGRLRFRVRQRGEGWMDVEVLSAGLLRPRKGINLLDHPIHLRDLTAGDAARLDAVRHVPVLRVAWSFTLDGREAAWVRSRVPGVPVLAKIERREAVSSLAEITGRVDGVWICRGDLGEQLGAGDLGRFVAALSPAALGCPVLMAGQVLEHLTAHAEPTRSEICHLHDLVARGYAGIVLSDETAIGVEPLRAVERAAALVQAFTGPASG